jgi:hypothetical protein
MKETSSKSGFAPNIFATFCALMIGGNGYGPPALLRLSRNPDGCAEAAESLDNLPPLQMVSVFSTSTETQKTARRRHQRGSVSLRGKREKVWVGRWRESVIDADGHEKRVLRKEVLGTNKDFPTKRLAERELEPRLSGSGAHAGGRRQAGQCSAILEQARKAAQCRQLRQTGVEADPQQARA